MAASSLGKCPRALTARARKFPAYANVVLARRTKWSANA